MRFHVRNCLLADEETAPIYIYEEENELTAHPTINGYRELNPLDTDSRMYGEILYALVLPRERVFGTVLEEALYNAAGRPNSYTPLNRESLEELAHILSEDYVLHIWDGIKYASRHMAWHYIDTGYHPADGTGTTIPLTMLIERYALGGIIMFALANVASADEESRIFNTSALLGSVEDARVLAVDVVNEVSSACDRWMEESKNSLAQSSSGS